MTEIVRRHIPEVVVPGRRLGRRLGRHVHHDPRSRRFAHAPTATALRRVMHRHYGPVLDQGDLGSCTANAVLQALMTVPTHVRGFKATEALAVDVYSQETREDGFGGVYPPDDTGSDGLTACKVATERGWISRYEHTFDLQTALLTVVDRPVIIGIDWYEGFDSPAPDGTLTISGSVRGGHELALTGIDPARKRVRGINSWGPDWPSAGAGGVFWLSFDTLGALLDAQGDVTVPIR